MKISFLKDFLFALEEQVRYIAQDKPLASKKFKNDLLSNLNRNLKNPLAFKKSIYYDNINIRDYVFKGYTIVFEVNLVAESVIVFGFIKHKNTL